MEALKSLCVTLEAVQKTARQVGSDSDLGLFLIQKSIQEKCNDLNGRLWFKYRDKTQKENLEMLKQYGIISDKVWLYG